VFIISNQVEARTDMITLVLQFPLIINNIKSNFECNENNQTKPTIHSRSCPAFIHSEIIIHDDKSATHAPIIGNTVTSTTCLKEIKGWWKQHRYYVAEDLESWWRNDGLDLFATRGDGRRNGGLDLPELETPFNKIIIATPQC